MRKSKALKILFLILSIALLVGSAIGIATSAEEGDTYEIKAINIAHGDRIQVLIAVDAPIEDAANIEVKYTIGGTEKVATYWKNIDIYGDGVEYPVYYTTGISAKDIGESVIAEAHKSGATDYTPKTRDVSVVEYLFTKLYKEGYIIATEGADANRKTLYLELIDYGAAAQLYIGYKVEYYYRVTDDRDELVWLKPERNCKVVEISASKIYSIIIPL